MTPGFLSNPPDFKYFVLKNDLSTDQLLNFIFTELNMAVKLNEIRIFYFAEI